MLVVAQDGDKFCWNEECWMSPVFSGYCHTGADDETVAPSSAPQSAGYINTFGRETLIDPALTSALQAPVKVGIFNVSRSWM